jgi:hypothetical protein
VQNEEDVVGFTGWSTRLAPGLDEMTNSNPNAVLSAENLVAVTSDVGTAREVALAFERLKQPETSVTSIVYGREKADSGLVEGAESVDPEHVAGHWIRRILVGGIPGAVLFAVLIGVGVYLVTGSLALLFGGAVGGAFFGFFSFGVWSIVIGTGQSKAYQDSFVDPATADVAIVALHADDAECIRLAEKEIAGTDGITVLRVDRHGESTPR